MFRQLFFILLWGCLHQQTIAQKKDTVVLLNGSLIIGELKNIQLGILTFDPDDANDITIQLRKIKSLQTHSNLFRVETIKRHVYYVTVSQSNQPGFVKLISPSDSVQVLLRDINYLSPFEKGLWNQMSGSVGLGFSYTRSSDLGRLNFDGSLKFASKSYELTFSANGIYTISDSVFNRDRENLSITGYYYFNASWFGATYFNYQRNIELGLARRYQEGIGIGNKFLTLRRMQAKAVAGLVLNQEKSTEGTESNVLVEVPLRIQYDFYRFVKPKINISFTEAAYFSLSQKGRVRNDGQLVVNWEMIDDLTLGLTFYNSFDNQPPVINSRKLDYGIVFNINYKF